MTRVDTCSHPVFARDCWQREARPVTDQRLDLYCAMCTTCGTTRTLVELWRQTFGRLSHHELGMISDPAHVAKRSAA